MQLSLSRQKKENGSAMPAVFSTVVAGQGRKPGSVLRYGYP